MADNDRIKIVRETMPSVESNGVTIILHNKMVSEYEAVILKTLSEVISDISKEDWNYDIKLAKAVVDRLFGEGL